MNYIISLWLDVLLICLIACYLEVILKGVKYSPLYVFTEDLSSRLCFGKRFKSSIELLCFPRFGLVINSRENTPRVSLSVPAGIAPDCRSGLSSLKPNKSSTVRIQSLPISKALRFNEFYNQTELFFINLFVRNRGVFWPRHAVKEEKSRKSDLLGNMCITS